MKMPEFDKKQMSIAGGALFVLILFVYFFFFRGASPTELLVPPSEEEAGRDVLVLVDKLSSVSIDPAIFSGPLFSNLRDSSIPITPESKGRPNPFAAFGADTGI